MQNKYKTPLYPIADERASRDPVRFLIYASPTHHQMSEGMEKERISTQPEGMMSCPTSCSPEILSLGINIFILTD